MKKLIIPCIFISLLLMGCSCICETAEVKEGLYINNNNDIWCIVKDDLIVVSQYEIINHHPLTESVFSDVAKFKKTSKEYVCDYQKKKISFKVSRDIMFLIINNKTYKLSLNNEYQFREENSIVLNEPENIEIQNYGFSFSSGTSMPYYKGYLNAIMEIKMQGSENYEYQLISDFTSYPFLKYQLLIKDARFKEDGVYIGENGLKTGNYEIRIYYRGGYFITDFSEKAIQRSLDSKYVYFDLIVDEDNKYHIKERIQ